MKRNVIIFTVSLFFLLLLPLNGYADETDTEYESYLDTYDFSFFEDTLGEEAYSLLEELGIDGFDYTSISSLSFGDIINLIKNTAINKSKRPFEGVAAVIAFVLLSAFFQSIKTESSGMSDLYSTASAVIISSVLIIKVSPAISISATCVDISSKFIYSFVPVFCAIIIASGGVTTSISANAMLMALSQGLSAVSSKIFMPMINCFLAIGICSSLSYELHLEKLVEAMKRIITTLISVASGLFVTVLSIKSAVSAKADLLGLRSLRFVVNSVVPVIGTTISEGLASIQSYSALIRSSVGIVGIIGVALVFLPAIVEVLIWRLVLSLSMIICDVFEDKSVSLVLSAFKDTMLLVNVVLVLAMMTTVISIGLLVAVKTS